LLHTVVEWLTIWLKIIWHQIQTTEGKVYL
jgi:hypothetical protein